MFYYKWGEGFWQLKKKKKSLYLFWRSHLRVRTVWTRTGLFISISLSHFTVFGLELVGCTGHHGAAGVKNIPLIWLVLFPRWWRIAAVFSKVKWCFLLLDCALKLRTWDSRAVRPKSRASGSTSGPRAASCAFVGGEALKVWEMELLKRFTSRRRWSREQRCRVEQGEHPGVALAPPQTDHDGRSQTNLLVNTWLSVWYFQSLQLFR